MNGHNFRYMNEKSLDEMEELLKSEHGTTLTLWSAECANIGAQSYRAALIKRVLACAVGVGAFVGVRRLRKKLIHKCKKESE